MPGFPGPCAEYCPFAGWVTMASVMTYALIAMSALLLLALLVAWLRRRDAWLPFAALLAVVILAAVSVGMTAWLLRANPTIYFGDIHYVPALANQRRLLEEQYEASLLLSLAGHLIAVSVAFVTGALISFFTLIRAATRR